MTQPAQETFTPYVSAEKSPNEFTIRGVLLGMVLAIVFGLANMYLGLRVGLTVSASIPAAVASMAILRLFFKDVSILENNIVQTIASAAESLAAGVIFTIPAFYFIGEEIAWTRILYLSALGGLLGVLLMVPLRRFLIVQEHGVLPYPEGTACSEILISGEEGGQKSSLVLWGTGIGVLHKALTSLAGLWVAAPKWICESFYRSPIAIDASPALLGVGFIVGPRIAYIIFSGGLFAWWGLVPLMQMSSAAEMTEIVRHLRFIAIGAILVGGFVGLIKALPVVFKTIIIGIRESFSGGSSKESLKRTDVEIPMVWILIGIVSIIGALWMMPGLPWNLVALGLVAVMAFLCVTISSMMVGLVGSSSNPVSGLILITILVTSMTFFSLEWTEQAYLTVAVLITSIVGMASAVAGDTSQDLKTGYLLGGTPRKQQLAEIVGVLIGACFMGGGLALLHQAYTIGSDELGAPQAAAVATILQGVMQNSIAWDYIFIGAVIGVVAMLLHLPILAFALGLYLPISLTSAIGFGGLVSQVVEGRSKGSSEASQNGILAASGMVAGDALMGVIGAGFVVMGWSDPEAVPLLGSGWSLAVFVAVAATLVYMSLKKKR